MQRYKFNVGVAVSVLTLSVGHSSFAGMIDELSPSDQRKVEQGLQVAIFEETSEGPWPKASIYQVVDSAPEEAAAVFFDVELHPDYIPSVTKTKIAKQWDRSTIEVDYNIAYSSGLISFKEKYTMMDHVEVDLGTGQYKVSWSLVRAEKTKKNEGSVRFESFGNKTLVSYKSFIVPGGIGTGTSWAIDVMKKTIKNTVTGLINQVQKEIEQSPALLAEQVERLNSALEGSRND